MKAWFDFVANLESHFGKETLDRWVLSLKILSYDACNLYLEAKDALHLAWYEEQIRPLVKNQFLNNNSHPIKVHLSIEGQRTSFSVPLQKESSAEKKPLFSSDPYSVENIFSSFIVSEKNDLPFQLLSQMSGEVDPNIPEERETLALGTFNPIFLHGKESSGKTHLLHATAAALEKKGLKPFYIKAQNFSQHVIGAMREGNMEAFRRTYRNADVLLIDDIHYFARKSATQEEFFHTFNSLHTLGKQIIITANCSPAGLKDIEPRLVSRFEWGISLYLELLEKKEMKEFLHQKAKHLGVTLSEEIFSFLIQEFGSSPSHIQKAVETLHFKMHLQEKKELYSLPQAQEILGTLSTAIAKEAITPEKIIESVAAHFGIQPEDITGNGRAREFSLPRQITMYLCRNRLQMPFQQIGRTLNRDHSTVMTSVRQIETLLEKKDKDLFLAYVEISKKL